MKKKHHQITYQIIKKNQITIKINENENSDLQAFEKIKPLEVKNFTSKKTICFDIKIKNDNENTSHQNGHSNGYYEVNGCSDLTNGNDSKVSKQNYDNNYADDKNECFPVFSEKIIGLRDSFASNDSCDTVIEVTNGNKSNSEAETNNKKGDFFNSKINKNNDSSFVNGDKKYSNLVFNRRNSMPSIKPTCSSSCVASKRISLNVTDL